MVGITQQIQKLGFAADAAITVAIPNANPYDSLAEASYSLAQNDKIEIHGFYSSTDNLYHLAVLS